MLRLFNVYVPTSVVGLLVSESILLYTCYIVAIALRLEVDPSLYVMDEGGFLVITVVVLTVMLGMYFQDLYTVFRVRSRLVLLQQVCLAMGIALIVQALLNYVQPGLLVPRTVMLIGSGLAIVMLPLWRLLYGSITTRGEVATKVLFIGTNSMVTEICHELNRTPEFGMRAVGFLDDPANVPSDLPAQYLGPISELKQVVADTRPARIVVGLVERRNRLPVDELLELRFSGIMIEQANSLYEAAFGRVPTKGLQPSDLIFTAGLGPHPSNVRFQAVYSVLVAAILLLIAAPIMVVVGILVKLTSPGPMLYGQTRMGLDDKPFTVYKFRSMRQDAEARTGAVWASKNDPRITPIGKWLRKLRLDELPQLFNVLRGDMSIVGPRPERPEFTRTLSQKIPFYRQRTCVKPGVTGWAQINHKYGDTIEDTIAKLEYDLYYIKHISFSLDMYIVFSTVKIVLLGRGAQ
jgi:sugar transferase (PEP-CTERM system associated)